MEYSSRLIKAFLDLSEVTLCETKTKTVIPVLTTFVDRKFLSSDITECYLSDSYANNLSCVLTIPLKANRIEDDDA